MRRSFVLILVLSILFAVLRMGKNDFFSLSKMGWNTELVEHVNSNLDLASDYLFFGSVQHSMSDYPNSLWQPIVEATAPMSTLTQISSLMSQSGISIPLQYALFFFVQCTLCALGIYLFGHAFKLNVYESTLCVSLYMWSYFSQIGRYMNPHQIGKVISSSFAMGCGLLILGVFVNGYSTLTTVLAAILLYLHPSHGVIVFSITFGFYLYQLTRYQIKFREWLKRTLIGVVLILPWLLKMFFTKMNHIVGQKIGSEWWEFLMARSSNPFPMQDGIMVVLPTLLLIGLMIWILLKDRELLLLDLNVDRIAWILGCIGIFWIVQIIGTELIRIPTIAQFALTRTTPYAILIFVCIFVRIVTLGSADVFHRFWFVILVTPFFFFDAKLFLLFQYMFRKMAMHPESLLCIGCLYFLFKRHSSGKIKSISPKQMTLLRACAIVVFIVICLLRLPVVYQFFGQFHPHLNKQLSNPVVLDHWIRVSMFLFCVIFNLETYKWFNQSNGRRNLLIVALIVVGFFSERIRMTLNHEPIQSSQLPVLRDQVLFQDFLKEHTNPGDMVFVLPLKVASYLRPMPARPSYVSSDQIMFTLYVPEILHESVQRLEYLGYDLDQIQSQIKSKCHGWRQYIKMMCRRMIFDDVSYDYTSGWRDHVKEMTEDVPNLKYALIPEDRTCEGEKSVFSVNGYVLMRLDQVVASSTCEIQQ